MLAACGVQGLADPTLLAAFGARVLLSHGDAWCIADVEYQQFRRQVRDPAWQARVLARPLAERRALARNLRSESERKASEHQGDWADVDTPIALQWLSRTNASTLVHGHTHRPASQSLAPGLERHVLSDWDLDHGNAPRAEVLRWERGGWSRLAPADAVEPAG
jgi:UDP-2,3-diacylglucosamine hydrolase